MQQTNSHGQFNLFSKVENSRPRLLVEWQPFWPQFLQNISDLLHHDPPPLHLTSVPGRFWPDVFVSRPVAWKDFARSAFLHAAVFFFVLMTGKYWLFVPN